MYLPSLYLYVFKSTYKYLHDSIICTWYWALKRYWPYLNVFSVFEGSIMMLPARWTFESIPTIRRRVKSNTKAVSTIMHFVVGCLRGWQTQLHPVFSTSEVILFDNIKPDLESVQSQNSIMVKLYLLYPETPYCSTLCLIKNCAHSKKDWPWDNFVQSVPLR